MTIDEEVGKLREAVAKLSEQVGTFQNLVIRDYPSQFRTKTLRVAGETAIGDGLRLSGQLAITDAKGTPYGDNWLGMQDDIDGASKWLRVGGILDGGVQRLTLVADLTYITGNLGIGTLALQHALPVGSDPAGIGIDGSDASPNAGYICFGDNTGWRLHFARAVKLSISRR